MSDVLYPLGLVAGLKSRRHDRVVKDEFEAGNSTARRLWAASNYKRMLEVHHTDLTFAEWRYLRSFYSQRGTYDSFWFRDNINRGGNAKVRFATDVPEQRGPSMYSAQLALEEVSPIRQLPEWEEVATAAGSTPVLWYDANREVYFTHAGTIYVDTAVAAYDAALQNYHAPWQGGSTLNLGDVLAQWQHYKFTGTEYAKTAGNVTELAGTQPACTIFLITRQSTSTTGQTLFILGTAGTNTMLGIARINGIDQFTPIIGSAGTWTNAKYTNVANTWTSLAAVWASASNTGALYANAVSIGSDSNVRSFTAGPATLGANPNGSNILNPANAMTNCNVAHALVFAAALTTPQIVAVHNLLGYQYGLAVV